MADKDPKSAYEIAMEKLQQKDRDEGRTGAPPLTAEQKDRIAGIRKEFEAKIAEMEIMRHSRLREAWSAEDPAEEIRKLEESWQRDRRRLDEERESRISKAREGKK